MTNDEIERHLTGLFGRRGYTVWPVPSRGEVAAALLICRGEQGVVVQVKRWNAALGPEVIRAIVSDANDVDRSSKPPPDEPPDPPDPAKTRYQPIPVTVDE